MIPRRRLSASLGGLALGGVLPAASATAATLDLHAIPMATHERAMRQAIEEARHNPVYPFGAVIIRAVDRELVARGVNATRTNPTLHGEIAAMNDYVARHGNAGWDACLLYTTGEPCPMCMSALVWAGIGGVVFGTSIAGIARSGINQIDLTAQAVINASPFYHGSVLGGVLQAATDQLFAERTRI